VDVLGDRTDPKIEANGYVAPIRDGMRLLQRVATSLRQARNFFFKRFSGLYGGHSLVSWDFFFLCDNHHHLFSRAPTT
jgi:hypothetical protein